MDKYQRLATITTLMSMGHVCVVCATATDVAKDMLLTKLDSLQPYRLSNLGLRHITCRAPRPHESSLEHLVECMILSKYKVCQLCKQSWVGYELDALTVVTIKSMEHVVHTTCSRV